MKILWLCNRGISSGDVKSSGTWLVAMASALCSAKDFELGILTSGSTRGIDRSDHHGIAQWVVPGNARLARTGLPRARIVRGICEVANHFRPDAIHVWGTEYYWGLLTARKFLNYPALLGMQGLKGQIAGLFCGGLSLSEQLRCIGIKELMKRRFIFSEKKKFVDWGGLEKEMIRGHKFISVQSPWMKAQVVAVNPTAHLFDTERVLRPAFHNAAPWQITDGPPVVFCSVPYASPFKGLHVAIRAFGLLRQQMPAAKLRIAGSRPGHGIRADGYMGWVNSLASELGLVDYVEWLGPLSGEQIAAELRSASAMVIPTFVESYCVALAEAMALGTPTVAAYTGGTSYLGTDEETCLFFLPGDEAMCAFQLRRLMTDRELAARLSRQARQKSMLRNDTTRIIQLQTSVYRHIIQASVSAGS